MSKSIVLIHGLNMNELCWEKWKNILEESGYTCYTVSYPLHSGRPEALRNKPYPELKNLTVKDVFNHCARFIQTLPESPYLIGHSMGGLIVQQLLNHGLGKSGVAICSAPARGIFCFDWHFLVSNLTMINLLKGNTLFLPRFGWFRFAVANTMKPTDARKIYDAYVLPESRNIPRSLSLKQGSVDFKKLQRPLLFIAAEKDHITPAKLNYRNYRAYKKARAKTEYKEYSACSHAIIWEEKWQEVAHDCVTWFRESVPEPA